MRIKRDAKCYLGPLPDSLPSPSLLKAGLQMVLVYKNSRSPFFWIFPFFFPQSGTALYTKDPLREKARDIYVKLKTESD